MKINLVKNMPCRFDAHRFSIIKGLDLKPSIQSHCGTLFCFKLCEQLKNITKFSIKDVCMVITLSSNEQEDSTIRVSFQDTFHILKQLKNILSDELLVGMTLHVNFDGGKEKPFTIVLNDIPVHERSICYDTCVSNVSNRRIYEGLLYTRDFEAHVSIYIFTSTSYPQSQFNQKANIYKRILDEGICHDAVIISQNGTRVNCHKCILIAHSTAFAPMFTSDMEERRTDIVKMSDMSEEGVRAFLEFLYYGNDTMPDENSSIAWELLNAGHKYEIPSLKLEMTNKLISKPIGWFDVDVAIKLLIFAGGLPSGKDLKLKSAIVVGLNPYARNRSPTYMGLPVLEKVNLLEWTLKALNMYFGSWIVAESKAHEAENVGTEPIPTTSSNTSSKRKRE